jgi:hypothetical protein
MAINASSSSRGRGPKDLIRALAARSGAVNAAVPGAFDWGAVGARAARFLAGGRAPGVSTMVGPLGVGVKARKMHQRRAPAAVGELVGAREVDLEEEAAEKDQKQTDRVANLMLNVLAVRTSSALRSEILDLRP